MAADVVIDHPNRETAAARVTRGAVVALLLVSAALMIVVSVGGWEVFAGAQGLQIAFIVAYLGMAVMVARWSRGILPLAAALAVLLLIFAAVAAPGWYARDRGGPRGRGGTGRHAGFRCRCRKAWGFESLRPHARRDGRRLRKAGQAEEPFAAEAADEHALLAVGEQTRGPIGEPAVAQERS